MVSVRGPQPQLLWSVFAQAHYRCHLCIPPHCQVDLREWSAPFGDLGENGEAVKAFVFKWVLPGCLCMMTTLLLTALAALRLTVVQVLSFPSRTVLCPLHPSRRRVDSLQNRDGKLGVQTAELGDALNLMRSVLMGY